MKINFLSPQGFSAWDHRDPETKGIGGSETAVVELSRRLAKRGHDVWSYAPTPDDVGDDILADNGPVLGWKRVHWRHLREADLTEPGYWIISRAPGAADLFPGDPDDHHQRLTLLAQDVLYFEGAGGSYTEERCAKFERVLALCPTHKQYLADRFPFLEGKLSLSSNGISSDRLANVIPAHVRDPFKMVWCSSPDRGLEALLNIWKIAVELEPRLNVKITYGMDNWNVFIDAHNARRKAGEIPDKPCPQDKMRDDLISQAEKCGKAVAWAGRMPQPQLWREIASAGLWCYPTTFGETSCIASQENMALGAIPITNDFWAVGDNVRYGAFITGNPLTDLLVRDRYVGTLVRLARDQEAQEAVRARMMPWALTNFSWERVVDQYEAWMADPKADVDWKHLPEV